MCELRKSLLFILLSYGKSCSIVEFRALASRLARSKLGSWRRSSIKKMVFRWHPMARASSLRDKPAASRAVRSGDFVGILVAVAMMV